jgi:FKBP-type peptidyl-prolyl cis-trans isomerase
MSYVFRAPRAPRMSGLPVGRMPISQAEFTSFRGLSEATSLNGVATGKMEWMRVLLSAVVFVLAVITASAQTPASQATALSDVATPPADATKTASGLSTKVLKPGTGKDRPAKDDVVTVDYTAWTADGKMFDSSVARGEPVTVQLKRMLPGLGEGVQLMVLGETRRLWIPESLAYKGQTGKPSGTLIFEVTLLDMPTHAPADVKAPPPDAKRTPSGMAYQVLKEGTGTRHPKKIDSVTVNYTGWTTDGKMFDSSVARGAPLTFPLDRVIPGWTEGVQLMVEGEKARFWIPQGLAYQGKQPPFGMLVFDIELIRIQ